MVKFWVLDVEISEKITYAKEQETSAESDDYRCHCDARKYVNVCKELTSISLSLRKQK